VSTSNNGDTCAIDPDVNEPITGRRRIVASIPPGGAVFLFGRCDRSPSLQRGFAPTVVTSPFATKGAPPRAGNHRANPRRAGPPSASNDGLLCHLGGHGCGVGSATSQDGYVSPEGVGETSQRAPRACWLRVPRRSAKYVRHRSAARIWAARPGVGDLDRGMLVSKAPVGWRDRAKEFPWSSWESFSSSLDF
jgi:hypothetical protein